MTVKGRRQRSRTRKTVGAQSNVSVAYFPHGLFILPYYLTKSAFMRYTLERPLLVCESLSHHYLLLWGSRNLGVNQNTDSIKSPSGLYKHTHTKPSGYLNSNKRRKSTRGQKIVFLFKSTTLLIFFQDSDSHSMTSMLVVCCYFNMSGDSFQAQLGP